MHTDFMDFERELSVLHARMRLIDWRNTQMQAITAQLHAAWPELEAEIDQHVAALPMYKVAKAYSSMTAVVRALLEPWVQKQFRMAAVRAQDDLDQIIDDLPQDAITTHAKAALTAAAGVGLIAASLVAIPSVLSFAPVTITSLLILSTSTISVPLLVAGSAVAAGMSLGGSTILHRASERSRANLSAGLKRRAHVAIFAEQGDPFKRCVLSDLQAAVLKSAQTTLEA